jgi:hypothetical protein
VYRELVGLEAESTFSFQDSFWLADVAPDLLGTELKGAVECARRRARIRETAEADIPDHLLYESGWPRVIPTPAEAKLLCQIRRTVSAHARTCCVVHRTASADSAIPGVDQAKAEQVIGHKRLTFRWGSWALGPWRHLLCFLAPQLCLNSSSSLVQ